jgi:glycerate kinase
MDHSIIDNDSHKEIMTPEEVAQYLKKSVSWVYKNWRVLGGVKLMGSIFFPRKEEIYERIFQKRQGVEVRLHPKQAEVHGSMVQHKTTGKGGRGKKTGRVEEPAGNNGSGEDANRHNLS